MIEDEFIRFLNETQKLISSHATGGAFVYARTDWHHMGEMPADRFVIAAAVDVSCVSDRTSPGPKPRLTPEQEVVVAELVREGPDLAKDGVVRWRRADLAHVIKTRFNVTWPSAVLARCCAGSGFGACRCGRAIRSRTLRRWRHTKKLCRSSPKPRSPSMRVNNRLNFGGRTKPGLVSRGTLTHVCLGRARQPSTRAAGSAPGMGLPIWRESRRPSPRSSQMASDGRKAAGSKKHQPTSPATLFP